MPLSAAPCRSFVREVGWPTGLEPATFGATIRWPTASTDPATTCRDLPRPAARHREMVGLIGRSWLARQDSNLEPPDPESIARIRPHQPRIERAAGLSRPPNRGESDAHPEMSQMPFPKTERVCCPIWARQFYRDGVELLRDPRIVEIVRRALVYRGTAGGHRRIRSRSPCHPTRRRLRGPNHRQRHRLGGDGHDGPTRRHGDSRGAVRHFLDTAAKFEPGVRFDVRRGAGRCFRGTGGRSPCRP
jgi:hypothetical protein